MSELENTMSMNSLMDAIFNGQQTEYLTNHEEQFLEQLPDFMRILINHLTQLCLTQSSMDNAARILEPWIDKLMNSHNKNPKSTIECFFKDYLRLLNQETQKMNKYGENKLKYLTSTVCRQIFTEIMRMSCDLKLESVNKNNEHKNLHKKNNYIVMLTKVTRRFFDREQIAAFKLLKSLYYTDIKQEQSLVSNLQLQIKNLDEVAAKNKKQKLSKAFNMWRKKAIQLSDQELSTLLQRIQDFTREVLPEIIEAWETLPKTWLQRIAARLSELFMSIFGGQENIYVQFVLNPNIEPANNSLDYSDPSSFRSCGSCCSMESVLNCLKKDEIRYENNTMMLPLIIEEPIGVFVVSWQDQLPLIFFHRAVKFMEMIKEKIESFMKFGVRLSYYNTEYEQNEWQIDLYNLYLRDDPIELADIEQIMGRLNISFLEIYHNKNVCLPCVSYGAQTSAKITDKIYKLIWERLDQTNSFNLERNGVRYEIVKLSNEQQGFCRYSFSSGLNSYNCKQENRATQVQCIVWLILKNVGKIGCEPCQFKIKEKLGSQLHPQHSFQTSSELSSRKNKRNQLNLSFLMACKNAKAISEVEFAVYEMLKICYRDQPIFARLFYSINESNSMYAYRQFNSSSQQFLIEEINIPKCLLSGNICEYEGKQDTKILADFAHVMHLNPLFENSSLYLYEKERGKTLKIIPTSIGRKALFVIASYEQILQTEAKNLMASIGEQINRNQNVFQKKDVYRWASDIQSTNSDILLPNGEFTEKLITGCQQKSLEQLISEINAKINFAESFGIWKVQGNNRVYDLCAKAEVSKFPLAYLSAEPIQSHQIIAGAHRLIRHSQKLGIKLQQVLTYLPCFVSKKQKSKYAQLILKQLESAGQLTDSAYSIIAKYLGDNHHFNKNEQQFLSLPIQARKATYIVVFIFNKDKFLHEKNSQALYKYLSEVLNRILVNKYQAMKWKSISTFAQNIKPKIINAKFRKIQSAIVKFYTNFTFNRNRAVKLNRTIKKVVMNAEARFCRHAFNFFKKRSEDVSEVYLTGCQFIKNKIVKVYALHPMFARAAEVKSKRTAVAKLHTELFLMTERLNSCNDQRINVEMSFHDLKMYSEAAHRNREAKKMESIEMIRKWCEKTAVKNYRCIFMKNFDCVLSLKKGLSLCAQEFKLTQPKSIQACIEFLSDRLNLIFNEHYQYKAKLQLKYFYTQIPEKASKVGNTRPIASILNYLIIERSSFGLIDKNQENGSHEWLKEAKYILQQILPQWEAKHRKQNNLKIKVMLNILQQYRKATLEPLFRICEGRKNKENINALCNIREQAIQERDKMYQLQYLCSAVEQEACKKEKHKTALKEIREAAFVLQHEEHKVGIEMLIKSKTNGAYRMMRFLNRRKEQSNYETFRFYETASGAQEKLSHARHLQICESLPIWARSVDRVMRRVQNRKIQQGVQVLMRFMIS